MNHPLNPDLPAKPVVPLGTVYATLAYTAWGLLPIYWKFLGQVSAIEILCHRMLWSMVFLAGLIWLQKRTVEFSELWRSPKRLGILLATATLLTVNWGLYIYAVNSDRVVEASLGYFMTPLVNVLLGVLFLKEQLTGAQKLAVLLASLGMCNFVWEFGQIPWIALELALSFGLYGLLRKVVSVAPMVGLATETLLITPLAICLIGYWAATGVGHLGVDWTITLLFMGSGVITALPLLWFNNAAKRLQLSTLGFFQYIAPTLQLILGVFLYHEPFTRTHVISFSLIWFALAIYSITALMKPRSS